MRGWRKKQTAAEPPTYDVPEGFVPGRVDAYLSHLDRVTGGAEAQFWPPLEKRPGRPGVSWLAYGDFPAPGYLTAFTYGLSLADHPGWVNGKPELCITMQSGDLNWGLAMAFMADVHQGNCPFHYGNVINFGEPLTEESPMTGFTVFTPQAVSPDDSRIEVGDTLPIQLVGVYPLHPSEMDFIDQHGPQQFWESEEGWGDFAPYHPHRPPRW